MDMVSPKNGVTQDPNKAKMIKDLLQLVVKASMNDTEGTAKALVNLSADIVPLANSTSGHHGNWSGAMRENNSFDWGNGEGGGRFNVTNLLSKLMGGNSNETDFDSNSTDVSSKNPHGIWGSLANISWNPHGTNDDLSTGLDLDAFGHMGENGREMPKATNHSTIYCSVANLCMITFIYYIPRMLYYRISRIRADSKEPTFVIIFFLSLITIAGAVIHVLAFHDGITRNSMVALITGQGNLFDAPDMFTPHVFKALTASINRVVSPIVTLLCLQQITTNVGVPILNKGIIQAILCIIVTCAIFGYTFFVEQEVLESVMEQLNKTEDASFLLFGVTYPDHYNVDMLDIVPPVITAVLFFVARNKASRTSMYTENAGPTDPSILDRVSKVVVFQTVMVAFAIAGLLMRSPEDDTSSFWTFCIAGQTPFVHWVLLRSLLRARKPTRLCFLFCCSSDEKIGVVPAQEAEVNKHPETNEPSQKNEDDEEEATQETLDHNKIILMREGQSNEEKDGEKEGKEEEKH